MLLYSILPLLATPSLAAPGFTIPASANELASQAFEAAESWVHNAIGSGKDRLHDFDLSLNNGLESSFIKQHGLEYLHLSHPAFPLHKLRIVQPKLCDSSVQQYSGYLDISETKHLFFWFEASRNDPKKDPVMLWLNGGPGCSSTTGHLFELGACNIADEGKNITYNPHSWNSVANVLYLDQPVNVGFSYSDSGDVNNSPAAAEDVYAFLMLFMSQFPEYSHQDFHVSGESYAGTYIPNIASVIHANSKHQTPPPAPGLPKLNLKSLLIGDGITDPYEQFGSIPEWACDHDKSPYALFEPGSAECVSMQTKAARCQGLIKGCYNTGSRFSCLPASLYCFQTLSPIQQTGLNIYDVRKKCDENSGGLCYKEMTWMETYLNQPQIKAELGVADQVQFKSCNMDTNRNFLLQGDGMHNAGALLVDLVNDGVRVLLYAGMADAIVNFIGCSRVLDVLPTDYSAAYAKATLTNFTDTDGNVVGYTKSAGKGAGNVAWVSFFNAGHMVPHDDPVGALSMVKRWLKNEPLA